MREIRFIDIQATGQQPIDLEIRQDGGAVGWCKPQQICRFRIRPKTSALKIAGLDFGEAAHEWLVHDLAIGGVSTFAQPPQYAYDTANDLRGAPLPADLFTTSAIEGFINLGRYCSAAEIVLDVSYVGQNPEGRPLDLIARCAVQVDLQDVPPDLAKDWSKIMGAWKHGHLMLGPVHRNVMPMNTGGERIPPGKYSVIERHPGSCVFTLDRLFISTAGHPDDAGPTPLEDWVICDLGVAGRTLCKQAGSLSGALFGSDSDARRARPSGIESDEVGVANDFLTFGKRALPWQPVTLIVSYNGPDPKGRCFWGSIQGTGQELDIIAP